MHFKIIYIENTYKRKKILTLKLDFKTEQTNEPFLKFKVHLQSLKHTSKNFYPFSFFSCAIRSDYLFISIPPLLIFFFFCLKLFCDCQILHFLSSYKMFKEYGIFFSYNSYSVNSLRVFFLPLPSPKTKFFCTASNVCYLQFSSSVYCQSLTSI